MLKLLKDMKMSLCVCVCRRVRKRDRRGRGRGGEREREAVVVEVHTQTMRPLHLQTPRARNLNHQPLNPKPCMDTNLQNMVRPASLFLHRRHGDFDLPRRSMRVFLKPERQLTASDRADPVGSLVDESSRNGFGIMASWVLCSLCQA